MDIQLIIGTALGYIIGMPILLGLFSYAQKKLIVEKAIEKAPKTKAALKNLPKPIWPKIKERIAFTTKDKRPLQINKKTFENTTNKQIFILILLTGLIIWTLAPILENWWLLIGGLLTFITAITYSYKTATPIITAREKIYTRMFEIGSSKGLIDNENADQPQNVIQILEWEDYIKPKKVEYQVRTEFSSAGEESFLQQFNQIFGNETAWVPSDNPETGAPGWNYDEGKVTLHAVPPLPGLAPWTEHYVLHPAIAWSFFPIALGVENGVELPNPETGEIEYVLGFDLSGEQSKIAKKQGIKVSPTITTSPMVFVGGGTGGGKSLSTDTSVKTIGKETI